MMSAIQVLHIFLDYYQLYLSLVRRRDRSWIEDILAICLQ